VKNAFQAGDKVTSSLFDGKGEVVDTRYERGITIVSVRTPQDSGVPASDGVSAYDVRDLRSA
jgi:hypothetical protein